MPVIDQENWGFENWITQIKEFPPDPTTISLVANVLGQDGMKAIL